MSEFSELIKRGKGRPRTYQTAEQLLTVFEEYVQHIEENPFRETDYRGKDAMPVTIKRRRPLTKQSFCIFAGITEWRQVEVYKEKGEDFLQVITYIEQVIYSHKLEGASAGLFNSSIIARDLGLADKREQDVKVSGLPDWMRDDEPQS